MNTTIDYSIPTESSKFLMNDDCSAEYQCRCCYNKNRTGQLLFTVRNKKQCFNMLSFQISSMKET